MASPSSEGKAGPALLALSLFAVGAVAGGLGLAWAGRDSIGERLVWTGLLLVVVAPFLVLLPLMRTLRQTRQGLDWYAAGTLIVVAGGLLLVLG